MGVGKGYVLRQPANTATIRLRTMILKQASPRASMQTDQPINTSLIIATLNRPEDLARCLESITRLTQGFDEIIIVEQGDMAKTEAVIKQFDSLAIDLYYHPIRSLTQARNLGMGKARGNFVFMVDDDTELDRNYVLVALEYFAGHPEVMGMTGYVGFSRFSISYFVRKLIPRMILRLLYFSSTKGVILRSGENGGVLFRHREQSVQYLPGCHMAYRKAAFDAGFSFNQGFIRWSFGEDVMLSYQIYKHYGKGSLMYVPGFQLEHHESGEVSLTDTSALRMKIVYRFIFWHREVYRGRMLNLIAYLYGQLYFARVLLRQAGYKKWAIKEIINAYQYVLKNHRAIAADNIDYNAYILEADMQDHT